MLLISINYFDPGQFIDVIWPLLLVPAILLVHKHPYWTVAIFFGIFASTLKLSTLLYIYDFNLSYVVNVEKIVGFFVNWSILLTLTYISIKRSQAKKNYSN
ncbi:hypothetical protein ACI2OX_21540 [Bacillus sp. N9]